MENCFLKLRGPNVKHCIFQFPVKVPDMLNTRSFHQTVCTSSGRKYPRNTTMVYFSAFTLPTVPSALTTKDGLHMLAYSIEVTPSPAFILGPGMTFGLPDLREEELENIGIWTLPCVSIYGITRLIYIGLVFNKEVFTEKNGHRRISMCLRNRKHVSCFYGVVET